MFNPDPLAALRLKLRRAGYFPIPCEGKVPPLKGWQDLFATNAEEIGLWSKSWHMARNTGVLCKYTPALDIDLMDEDACEAIETLVGQLFDDGRILIRIGKAPKRLIPLRAEAPFKKLILPVTAPNGGKGKIEFLGDGQQFVVDGIHPETKSNYCWHGADHLADVAARDLPLIRDAKHAQEVLDKIGAMLVADHGYTLEQAAKQEQREQGGPEDWAVLIGRIHRGEALHDSLCALAGKTVKSGMNAGAAVNILRGILDNAGCPHDDRWRDRRAEIPRLVQSAEGEPTATPRPSGPADCANTIMTMHFAAIKYVIPGIVVEGLTLLAGKPKIGKSWLLMHAAVAVATGGFTLGQIHCPQGDVLYAALEDNKRRVQSRLKKLTPPDTNLSRLFFYTYDEMGRLAQGGLETIRAWLGNVAHPRLVIIDTLAVVRSAKKKDESSYDSDYNAVLELRKLAHEFGVAIIVVHHLRKADSDDAFDTVSGTLGLTGAPDTILILKYDSSGTIVLHGRGRDLVEIEKAMSFNREDCTWQVAGDASDQRHSTERAKVLDTLKEASEPIGPNDIAAITGMRAANVRRLLTKLGKDGAVERVKYGRYRAKG